MKQNVRRVLQFLIAVVFVVSAALVIRQLYDYHAANQPYETAQNAAQNAQPTPKSTPIPVLPAKPTPGLEPAPTPEPTGEPLEEGIRFLMETGLDALRKANERVLGWIY